jgi:hypothetical protein
MGNITEIASGAPGYSSVLPNSMSPLPREPSCSTATPPRNSASATRCRSGRQVRPAPSTPGPRRRRLRVFLWLHRRRGQPVVPPRSTRAPRRSSLKKTPEEGYHLIPDMTDKAIKWIGQQQKALTPDKPFFIYFAPGATHAPHHVPKEWADKYKGKFDRAGTASCAKRIFARQKQLGVIPADCELTARPKEIPVLGRQCPRRSSRCCAARWRSMPGFLEYTDHHVGRLSRRWRSSASSTTRSSTTSSATTAPRPRARSTAASTR